MSIATKSERTVAEYLEFERNSEFRHEYYHGEIRQMTGGTRRHILAILNFYEALLGQLPKSQYFYVINDMRVKVNPYGLYTYPDLVIAKGVPEFEDDREDTLLNPIVLMEALSESTEKYDRGEKFELYQGIPSLREYILVAQNRPEIDQFVRNDTGAWMQYEYRGLSEILKLQSIPCSIPLATIYERIVFDSDA